MGDHASFAVFILTHGRADSMLTPRTLQRSGYTGRIVYVIDDEDGQADEYRRVCGAENVVVFDKAAAAQGMDEADTTNDRRAVVYARNASQRIAREMGLDYLLQLDDDYNWFRHSWLADGAEKYPPPVPSE